jgi:tripartite ATP-independent transporter DctM subunit
MPESIIDRPVAWAAAALLLAEVLVIALQVVSRHVLSSSIPWTEEIARVLLIWLMLFGGVVALRRGEHTRVTALIRLLPPDVRAAVDVGIKAVLAVFLVVLGYQSLLLTADTVGEQLPASRLSGALVNAPMPLTIGLMVVLLAQEFAQRGLAVLRTPRGWGAAGAAALLALASVALPQLVGAPPIVVLVLGFVVTGALGMPLAFALGLVSLIYLVGIGGVPLTILPIKIIGGVDSFVLLAIPLFIFGGALMETGGISQRIVALATALIGHVRGGLAMVVVVAEMLFSGISGSTAADVSAMSSLLIPSMKKAGYKPDESISIVAAASAMGILVPPCLTMVVLGALANLSIVTLFLAGFVPAIVLALAVMVVIYVRARQQGWPVAGRASLHTVAGAGRGAAIPLGMPLIIFGGIFSGLVTVTEAALIAVVYALAVGLWVYRELALKDLPAMLVSGGSVTAMTLWVLATASVFAWILAREQVPLLFAQWIAQIGGGTVVFMLLTIAIFVVIGALLEGLPALLIFGPILFPIAQRLGIDPIHYGIVIVASMGIAFFLPPVGVGLFIACGIGNVDINLVFRSYMPYLAALLIGLVLIAFVPFFTLIVPQLIQGYGG